MAAPLACTLNLSACGFTFTHNWGIGAFATLLFPAPLFFFSYSPPFSGYVKWY
jgi:hypothetical protein